MLGWDEMRWNERVKKIEYKGKEENRKEGKEIDRKG